MKLPLIERAATIAAKGHKNQFRAHDETPYIVHPFMVARKLMIGGADDTTVAAALVHDVLEDTDIGSNVIARELGEDVLEIVKTLSEDKKLPWKERKLRYIEQVREGGKEAKLISLADKVHNMENMKYAASKDGDAFWKKMSGGKSRLWFDRAMIEMFRDTNFTHPLIEDYKKLIEEVKVM